MRLPLIVAWLICSIAFPRVSAAQAMDSFGTDLHNRPVRSLQPEGARTSPAFVLLFLATDCPISNRYVPEIRRLEQEFASKGIVFWQIYPNAGETAEGVLRHQGDYGLQGAALIHPSARLKALAAATITPEVAVLVPAGSGNKTLRVVYLGRIDDRYIDIGRQRPSALRHDLEEAITAVLRGQAVPPPGGPPVGCGIIPESLAGKR